MFTGMAVPGRAQLTTPQRQGAAQRILVVRGGLAGLCAAYELSRQGHDVLLFEAQTRPGGRVKTLREGLGFGLTAEAGAARIPDTHEFTLHYVREFGLELELFSPGRIRRHVSYSRPLLSGNPKSGGAMAAGPFTGRGKGWSLRSTGAVHQLAWSARSAVRV